MTDKSREAEQYSNPPPYGADGQGYTGYPVDSKQQGTSGQPYVYMQQPPPAQVVYVGPPQGPPPPDNLAYAIFVTFCCCWPIGAFAILRSMDSRRAWGIGDVEGARKMAERSRTLSHWALGVGLVFVVLSLVAVGLYIGLYLIPILWHHDYDK